MSDAGYPPADHILRDLGIHVEVPSATTARARIPVTADIAGADGGVRPGVLAVLVDLAGGAAAVRSLHPDWMATADLSVRLARPAVGPWVEARAAVIRRGTTTLVIEAGIFNRSAPDVAVVAGDSRVAMTDDRSGDAPGQQVGLGTLTMAVLPARPGSPSVAVDTAFPVEWSFGQADLGQPVVDALSVRVLDRRSGSLAMPLVPYVHNSFGAAQGGVMALLAELSGLAAVEAAGREAGVEAEEPPRLVAATELQVAYLALGRVGPITSRADVLSATGRGGRAVVELTDEGSGGRLTTMVHVGTVAADPSGTRG